MKSSRYQSSLVPDTDWLARGVGKDQAPGAGFLLLLCVLAAALRFHALTGQSLWVDEVMSWSAIRPGAGLDFFEQVRDAIQGPLYLAVTWPLLRLQDSVFMLRLPSAVAGILTVPLLALAAGRLFDGRTARLAGLLIALAPFHVWYSQEGRGYALLMFFAVAMGYLLLRMIEEGIKLSSALLFALCSACAAWSNMSGLFLWAAMGMGVLLLATPRTGREWGLWALAFGGGLVAVLPWILKAAGIWAVDRAVVGNATGAALRGETTFTPVALPYTIFTFSYGYSLGPSLRELHGADRMAVLGPALPLLAAAAVPVGVGLVAGLFSLRRRSLPLLFWIIVPVAVLAFLALRNIKPWNPRYVAVAYPWFLALLARGLVRLPRKAGAILSVLLVGLALFSLGNYYWNGRYAKADVREITALVHEREAGQAGTAEPILVPVVANVFNYYYRGSAEIITSFGTAPLLGEEDARLFLDRILSGRERMLFVAAREWFFDPEDVLPAELARRGNLRLVAKVPGAKLYSWRCPGADRIPDEH